MKRILHFLGYLFFIYAILLFVVTMLIVAIPVWISTLFSEPRRSKVLHPVFKLWMSIYLPLVGCPVIRKGKKHFKKGKNYIVVINHNSLADIPVSSPWIPGANKTLAKAEMAKIPIFGLVYKAGSILVNRKNENSRRESFTKMQEMLDLGLHLCLYPEGTRNKTNQPLQPFYDGAFIAAIKAQKPIIPAIIFNTKKIYPAITSKVWARPLPIHIHFLEPIETDGMTHKDTAALKERVRQTMENYFVDHRDKL
ncbi:MAG: 1-acyl-sn-glycerol-3-phosphate acyltransferase [Bacteroidetes bacterium]|nr:1-acyl-sn-glycerol-3-phosphate acyltransferase [Bacteroidota bacterium]MBS1739132.1 1-acyl-sn-glycerol-3-phosphate acyltransferase [Bacteroidota bacterium]MBS1740601.1 1-acyl-sn-glycerol-3-phosphate acyltransferase [Bacteroidota bacterium]